MIYLLSLCDVAGIDLAQAVREKVALNERRFPVAQRKTEDG